MSTRNIMGIPIPSDNESRYISGNTLAALLLEAQQTRAKRNHVVPQVQPHNAHLPVVTKRRPPLQVTANSAIAAYTVFGVAGQDAYAVPTKIHVDYIGAAKNASNLLLLTSGQHAIANGAQGNAWVVDYYEPITLLVAGAGAGKPKVGNPCGIELDTGKVIKDKGCDFVCLTDKDADNKVVVMRNRYTSLFVKCAEDIATGSTGSVTVSDDAGNDWLEPETSGATWPLKAYNPTPLTFYTGQLVMVRDVINVGLCITPDTNCNYFVYGKLTGGDLHGGTDNKTTRIYKQSSADGSLTDSGIDVSAFCPACPTGWHIPNGTMCAMFLHYSSGLWNALVPFACLVQD